MSIGWARRCRPVSMSRQTVVAMRYSHDRSVGLPSHLSSLRHAPGGGVPRELRGPTPGLIPDTARVHPARARPAALGPLLVAAAGIGGVRPAGRLLAEGRRELAAAGQLLPPPLVDPHVHMDAV